MRAPYAITIDSMNTTPAVWKDCLVVTISKAFATMVTTHPFFFPTICKSLFPLFSPFYFHVSCSNDINSAKIKNLESLEWKCPFVANNFSIIDFLRISNHVKSKKWNKHDFTGAGSLKEIVFHKKSTELNQQHTWTGGGSKEKQNFLTLITRKLLKIIS